MEKITKYFMYTIENDTTIEYVATETYSMLNCSYTSEDPDYGTDTIHFRSSYVQPMAQMAYNMLYEVKDYLDYKDGVVDRPIVCETDYEDYSLSTLIAFEYALAKISKDYNPGKWYMTIREAAAMVTAALRKDRTKVFSFVESDPDEANGDPRKHRDDGNWHGIKRIDGFFNNDESEFIVAVGYWGGGHCTFGYCDIDSEDPTLGEIELVTERAMAQAIDLKPSDYIYIEEEKNKGGEMI